MKTKLSKTSVLMASQNQVSADLSPELCGDEVVILDLKEGTYYELSEVGARIWTLMQQPRSIQAVLDTLIEEYDVAPQQCEEDVLALVEDLARHGLVEIKDGPHP